MSNNVKRVNFGKETREAARTFCRLFDMLEAYEADVLRNPGKYLAQACDYLGTMREGIRRAQDCLRFPAIQEEPEDYAVPSLSMETICVPKDEWKRAMACIEVVKRLCQLNSAR